MQRISCMQCLICVLLRDVCGTFLSAFLAPKFLSILFPLSLLLRHELKKFRRLSDRVQKGIAREEWVVRESCRRRFLQPFHRFATVSGEGVNTGCVIRRMMTGLVTQLDRCQNCGDA